MGTRSRVVEDNDLVREGDKDKDKDSDKDKDNDLVREGVMWLKKIFQTWQPGSS